MAWSTELTLALLIAALYLKDCLLLLQPHEAVLVRGRAWRAGFGLRQWTLAGREPYWANPLLPHQAVFRLQWNMLSPALAHSTGVVGVTANAAALGPAAKASPALATTANAEVDEPQRLTVLRRLGPLVWLSWLLLFAGIPLTVLGRWGVWATVTALVLLYLNIVASLLWVWIKRVSLGLNPRAFALLAFECLACAPYAANLVRRLSWRETADGEPRPDFTQAAARVLPPPAWEQARAACRVRVQDQIDAEAEGTARARALEQSLQYWSAMPATAEVTETTKPTAPDAPPATKP
jgi:hypothetical protein